MIKRISNKQPNSRMCFVCGLKNDFGLKASFYESETNELIAVFTPDEVHQSYPNRLHGGVTSAILDETIGRAIMIKNGENIWGVTVELNIKFKKPVPLNEEIKVIGRITNENSRFFEGSGEIILKNGDIAASGIGKYLKMTLDKITDFKIEDLEWKVYHKDNDPLMIDIIQQKNSGK
jgi:acyl-coenzyme A thioesterase PaaI-like protein